MRIVLVHNPGAGDCLHSRDSLARLIAEHGHVVEAFSSKDHSWAAATLERAELVVAAGGDGTVAEVARTVAGRAIPIAVMPLGTANNIACALGQENVAPDELVAGWEHGVRRPFDLGVARGAWGSFPFLESVGAGLLAETMAEIDEGAAQYVNAIEDPEARLAAAVAVFERVLRRIPACAFEIAVDGLDLSGEYVLVEALNFGAAGPNLRLAPQAGPSDGLLDVVLVDAATRRDLVENFRLYQHDPSRAPRLPVYSGRHVRIGCRDVTLHLDDELRVADPPGEVELTVEPGALTFLVPVAGAGGIELRPGGEQLKAG